MTPLKAILYLFILACCIQAAINVLEYRRTNQHTKLWAGALGFVLLALGIGFLIIVASLTAEIDRRIASNLFQIFTALGILLWMSDQIIWMTRRTTIVPSKPVLADPPEPVEQPQPLELPGYPQA